MTVIPALENCFVSYCLQDQIQTPEPGGVYFPVMASISNLYVPQHVKLLTSPPSGPVLKNTYIHIYIQLLLHITFLLSGKPSSRPGECLLL